MAAGAGEHTFGAVHGQRQGGGTAGGHSQAGLARAVVHQLTVAGGAVDLDGDVARCQRQAFDALKGGTTGAGLQTEPLAWAGDGGLAHQRQAKRHPAQAQAHRVVAVAVDAGKRIQVGAAQGEQVHVADRAAIGEHHRIRALVQGQTATEAEETKSVEVDGGAGLQRFALRTIRLELGDGASPCDVDRSDHPIDDGVLCACGLVDVQTDVGGGQGQATDTGKAGAVGGRLQGDPGARAVLRVAGQGQGKVEVGERQAHGAGAVAPDARKTAGTRGTHGEHLGLDRAAIGQGQRLLVACHVEVAIELHKTKQPEAQLARGLHHFTLAALEVECQRARRVEGDAEAGFAAGVVDHRIVALIGQVEGDGQVGARGGDAVDAVDRDALGRGFERGPAAGAVGLGAHQRESEFDPRQGQADAIGHADLGAEAGAAQREQIDREAVGGFVDTGGAGGIGGELDRLGRAVQGQAAVEAEEVADHHMRVGQHHIALARLQGPKRVAGIGDGDLGAIGDGAGGGVPGHAHRGGAGAQGVAQREIGGARGFEHDAAALDDQGHAGVADACVHVARAQAGTGRAGQHFEVAAGAVALKGKVTREHDGVTDACAQAADLEDGGALSTERGQGIRQIADRQRLGLQRLAGAVESQQGHVGADLSEAATREVEATGRFEGVAAIVVEQQTKAAVANAHADAAGLDVGREVLAGHLQAATATGKAHAARQAQPVGESEVDGA